MPLTETYMCEESHSFKKNFVKINVNIANFMYNRLKIDKRGRL